MKTSLSTIKEIKSEEDEYLYVNRLRVKTIKVPISVSGISGFAVVDTGAEATVLNNSIYEQIPGEVRPPLSQAKKKLVVAEAGKEMSVYGMTKIDIEIGGFKFKWPVYVAPIREDLLLGWDMIFHHKFAIDPEQGFQVKTKWIKIEVDSPKRKSAVTEVNQAVTNPKLSELILCYKCQDKIEGDYPTEPIVQNRIIVAEPTEIAQKDCVSVCNSKQLDLQKHKEKEKTLVGCHNETNVLNSEMTYSPVSNLKTCSNDTISEHRVENKINYVKNKCVYASGPKMPEVVLRNIGEETVSSRIEENMYNRGDLAYMYMYEGCPESFRTVPIS